MWQLSLLLACQSEAGLSWSSTFSFQKLSQNRGWYLIPAQLRVTRLLSFAVYARVDETSSKHHETLHERNKAKMPQHFLSSHYGKNGRKMVLGLKKLDSRFLDRKVLSRSQETPESSTTGQRPAGGPCTEGPALEGEARWVKNSRDQPGHWGKE